MESTVFPLSLDGKMLDVFGVRSKFTPCKSDVHKKIIKNAYLFSVGTDDRMSTFSLTFSILSPCWKGF